MNKILFTISFVMCSTLFLKSQVQNITLEISTLRNYNGKIQVQLFRNGSNYDHHKPDKEFVLDKSSFKNPTLTYSFTLEPGTWGIAILDDENGNKQMDFSWLGIPEEGFGFSDYYHTGFTSPKFEDFSFNLKAGEQKKSVIKIRYM